jgi:hypothetical protein
LVASLAVWLGCALVLANCNPGPVAGVATPTPLSVPVPQPDAGVTPTRQFDLTPEPAPFTDSIGMPFPVPSTAANPILTVNRQTAWGRDLSIRQMPASVDDQHIFMLSGVAEDGRFVVGTIVPRDRRSMEKPRIALMDTATGRLTEIATAHNYASNAYFACAGATVDGDWVVWQEGRKFRVYNVVTQALSEVQPAARVGSDSIGPYALPSTGGVWVDNGILVWAERSNEPAPPDKMPSVVKTYDLATGSMQTVGRYGAQPVISWPIVAWIEPDLTTEVDGELQADLVALNLQTGERRTLIRFWSMREIGIHGDAIVGRSGSMVFLINLDGTRKQVIAPENMGWEGRFTMNERLVTACHGPDRVWDRAQDRLVSLNGYGYTLSKIINGHMLAWQSVGSYKEWIYSTQSGNVLPGDLAIHLLDTSQLPK